MPSQPRDRRSPSVALSDEAAVADAVGGGRRGAARGQSSTRDPGWSILMARAQQGDREAYRRLLEEIAPFVRALAARRHRDPRDVEDTVQDVLLTVHAIRHTYDPARPFTPGLVAIAHRRAIDRLRQQSRSRLREAALQAEHETFRQLPANIEEADIAASALRAAVEGLPPGQRQAVTLLKLREMSLKQAAEASGSSIAALKVALHRAMKNLRKILGRKGEEET
jgi:RNA polymerase sigma-70 factor (ECF subfamily)